MDYSRFASGSLPGSITNNLNHAGNVGKQHSLSQTFEHHQSTPIDTLEKSGSYAAKKQQKEDIWVKAKRHYKALLGITAGSLVLVLSGRYLKEQFARPGVAKILNAYRTSTSEWKAMLAKHTTNDIKEMTAEVCRKAKAVRDDSITKGKAFSGAIAAQYRIFCGLPLIREIPLFKKTLIASFSKGSPSEASNMGHELLHAFQNQHQVTNVNGKMASIWAGKANSDIFQNIMPGVCKAIEGETGRVSRQKLGALLTQHGLDEYLKKQGTGTLKNLKLQYLTEIVTHRQAMRQGQKFNTPVEDLLNDWFCVDMYTQFNNAIRRELRRRGA